MPDSDPRVWARGKTADEVLGIASQLYGTLESTIRQPAPAQPSAAPTVPSAPQISDDDYVNGATLRQMAPQYVQQYIQPQMQAFQSNIAQSNLELVKNDPKCASVFQKYGPEVYNKLASVDKSLWNVDNLRTIVNLVKADHVDELAREEAARLAAAEMATFRSSGAGMSSVPAAAQPLTLQSETLPGDYRERLAKVGVTESTLDEFCRANDMTRAEFFKQFGQTAVGDAIRG